MNESNMKPFTSDLVDSPAAWYGRDLQNDDSWVELLTDAEVDEIQHAIKRVNSQRISMLEMKREDFPLPTLGNRLQGICLLYTSPSPRDGLLSRMPSSA